MEILKTASDVTRFLRVERYYGRARDGMHDLLRNMIAAGLADTVLVPAYVGWSPREGSGIFDPLISLDGLTVHFYKMTRDLDIDLIDLTDKIVEHRAGGFAVLVVNYFGFVDPNIRAIARAIKERSGWIIEDSAHGFFTYQYTEEIHSDAAFFSLHKMFPFKSGGSLVVTSEPLKELALGGSLRPDTASNPWEYDIRGIAQARRHNYAVLESVVASRDVDEFFVPLKPMGVPEGTVPQTFPILVKRGDRDRIYESMNRSGYGVVSLYHTLIEPLRRPEFATSLDVSRQIMNLPVHQDVDSDKYGEMIGLLVELCKETADL